MDGSWVFYEQLGVWCNFNIPWLDSLPRPPILGIAPHPNGSTCDFWKRDIALHFGESMVDLLYKFNLRVARITIICQMVPLLSELTAAMENDLIAAI